MSEETKPFLQTSHGAPKLCAKAAQLPPVIPPWLYWDGLSLPAVLLRPSNSRFAPSARGPLRRTNPSRESVPSRHHPAVIAPLFLIPFLQKYAKTPHIPLHSS